VSADLGRPFAAERQAADIGNGSRDESPPPFFSMRRIVKRFPGVLALNEVDFDLRRGEVHVLLGENGAGKSTLIKVLSGVYPADSGDVLFDGKPVAIHHPLDAQRLGVSTIYQELNLVPEMTVAENIYLGREPMLRFGFVDRKEQVRQARDMLARLQLDVDPNAIVRTLGIAQQQMVEIAKALSLNARLIVMDEPTAVLTTHEIERLFATIAQLRAGGVGVIYISHRLDEIRIVGDRATVLRDGSRVGTVPVASTPVDQLIRMMVGRDLKEKFAKVAVPIGAEALRVENLTRRGVIEDVSFHVRRGEILGIAGLVGAGRTETARVIFGADPRDSGRVLLHGKPIEIRSPAEAIKQRIALLPEDRKRQGILSHLSIKHNVTLTALGDFVRGGLIDRRKEHKHVVDYAATMRIASPDLDRWVYYLSGGNQQKVVIAKWLSSQADIFLFDEPTRGIDVGAKVEVYQLMSELVKRGAAIVMISSELPEILGMSDRIMVMHDGRMCGEFTRAEATEEKILDRALRGAPQPAEANGAIA
jgi:ribose transport system ATP-binding protein